MRVIGKVVLFLVPIFFVLGLVRFYFNNLQGDFIPSWGTFLAWFESFPDVPNEMNALFQKFNDAKDFVACAPASSSWWDVFLSFTCRTFTSFGNWFDAFAQLIGYLIVLPFRAVGWLFSIIAI